MRRFFSSLRPRAIALACVSIYVSAAVLSLVVSHVLLIAKPESGLGQRLISPVAKGLEFLDAHWKSVLMLIVPFVAPLLRDLVPRLRKVGAVEFDPVPVETVGVREQPTHVQPGGTQ